MKKYIFILVVINLIGVSSADSKIRRFQSKIEKVCSKDEVSLLLLKKSLIEMIKGEECSGKFTGIVLSKCDTLNCKKINEIYKEVEQVRSGSVVGDE